MKKKNFIPRGKYALVKPDDEDKKLSEGGLATPDSEESKKKSTGIVISVGEIKDIKKGDHVVYATFAGDPLEMEKVEYMILHDDDILGFVE